MPVNRNLVLIAGEPGTGKSLSLMSLKNPKGVVYLNCENGKELPFKSEFQEHTVTHPKQVLAAIANAEKMKDVHTIVIDSLTRLMSMHETVVIEGEYADDTRKGWGEYRMYFMNLMQNYVTRSSKNIIFIAHTETVYSEKDMIYQVRVPMKGALKGMVESYFCTVIAAKRVTLNHLEAYNNPLLITTDLEKELGYKYVFQCNITRDTIHERIRGAIGMFDRDHTYIDNNAQALLDHIHDYYK
jgi:hypothetical protein